MSPSGSRESTDSPRLAQVRAGIAAGFAQ